MSIPTLTADAGSTKTTWLLTLDDQPPRRINTRGINPFLMSDDEILSLLRDELLAASGVADTLTGVGEVRFYGAGCRDRQAGRMRDLLLQLWPQAVVIVGSDIEGAARALFGPSGSGIACILGTGSNSSLYEEGHITAGVAPLGYILGDEGSGAVLGRRLVGDVLKQQLPPHVCEAFMRTTGLSLADIIERVYRQDWPNRFLASLVPFISEHVADEPSLQALVCDELKRFFNRNVALYKRPDLPVAFVGGVACAFAPQLREVAQSLGYNVTRILRNPLDS